MPPTKHGFRAVLFLITVIVGLYLYLKKYSPGRGGSQKQIKDAEGKSGVEKKDKRERKAKVPHKYKAFVVAAKQTAKGSSKSTEELEALHPTRFEKHGHVVVVQQHIPLAKEEGSPSPTHGSDDEGLRLDGFAYYAEAFAQSLKPPADVVVLDDEGIGGELRTPLHRILWTSPKEALQSAATIASYIKKRGTDYKFNMLRDLGLDLASPPVVKTPANEEEAIFPVPGLQRPFYVDISPFEKFAASPTFTTHMENQTKYSFDALRVMFCSGNTDERMRFGGSVDAKDEVVVDMFAGIGYFTIPLAMRGGPTVIHALEKNPDSCEFLRLNAIQNKVEGCVVVHCGDNREVTGSTLVGRCDRVLMGYIPSCKEFLPRAFSFLKVNPNPSYKGGPVERLGVVHYHFLCGRKEAHRTAYQDVISTLGIDMAGLFAIQDIHLIKSYSPKTYHYVADIQFGRTLN